MKKVTLLIAMLSLGTLCWAGTAGEDATERLDNATNVLHESMGMQDNGAILVHDSFEPRLRH